MLQSANARRTKTPFCHLLCQCLALAFFFLLFFSFLRFSHYIFLLVAFFVSIAAAVFSRCLLSVALLCSSHIIYKFTLETEKRMENLLRLARDVNSFMWSAWEEKCEKRANITNGVQCKLRFLLRIFSPCAASTLRVEWHNFVITRALHPPHAHREYCWRWKHLLFVWHAPSWRSVGVCTKQT